MNGESFEWDDTKAAENYASHGVSFEAARDVFKDAFAVAWLDERVQYMAKTDMPLSAWWRAACCMSPTP